MDIFHCTPCIQICTTKPVFSLWNFLSDVIDSKSVVISLKHVQYSRIRVNGGVSFITFRVHVYKICITYKWECNIVKDAENYHFLCVITVLYQLSIYEMDIFHCTPCIQICTTKPVFSLWNFLSDVIDSKSVVISLKHVQYSRIRVNGGVSFITFRVHVYKIL